MSLIFVENIPHLIQNIIEDHLKSGKIPTRLAAPENAITFTGFRSRFFSAASIRMLLNRYYFKKVV